MSNQPDRRSLESVLGAGALAERPHLFSDAVVSLPAEDYAQITAFVQSVMALVSMPTYTTAVGVRQGEPIVPMPPGVCLGFDFHMGGPSPQLIEINTNAGGGLLVTTLERAWGWQRSADDAETMLLQMFADEWAAWQCGRPLSCIALVDEAPEQQYLYPEFVRWQKLFEAAGIHCLVCAPEALRCDDDGRLWHGETPIDLLYNRLTDFSLTSDACQAIQAAWQAQRAGLKRGTLITPHPQAHALWADKRNLEWLSNPAMLRDLGLDEPTVSTISRCVPRTVPVLANEAEQFWATRKQWFFKPQAGFGSRATYRGDKVTRRVFEEILQGGYVAQTFAPPPELDVSDRLTGEVQRLKYDLRVYAYQGQNQCQIQLVAARLYQGQTTNFRTPGGGFAPVRVCAGQGPSAAGIL